MFISKLFLSMSLGPWSLGCPSSLHPDSPKIRWKLFFCLLLFTAEQFLNKKFSNHMITLAKKNSSGDVDETIHYLLRSTKMKFYFLERENAI